ncbi:MAG TPA: OB-fold domain-containing protein [Streptosporangiaceae bacterium]|jgi:hypothetical protein
MSTDVPVIRRDEASAPFFDGAAREELLIRRCAGCGRTHAPTVTACPDCGGTDLAWVPAAGTATLVTWAVPYDRASAAPALVFALVELAEGPWMHTRVDADPAALHAGQPLSARFVHPDDGESFTVFVPA